MAQGGPTSPPYNPGTTSSATPNDSQKALSIASEWQRLTSMYPRSPNFLPLLSTLIFGGNQSPTTKLQGEDARIALSALDEIFRGRRIPSKYERDTRSVMRALAYGSCQVPPRYQVKPDSLSVESGVFASGASSDIRRGRLGAKTVAVRTLKACGTIDARKRFCKECIIWMSVSHPHLLQLIAVDINPSSGQCSMISEMMLGNIKGYISSNPALTNLNRLCLLHEAAMGLNYLHKREIIHGDLKGHNILITNGMPARACLADFGLSTLAPSVLGEKSTITAGGTPIYMAPELLNPDKYGEKSSRPTKPADIYAFGMVIYEVLTGVDPFHDKNSGALQLVCPVVNGLRPTKPRNAKEIGLGSGTWELVKECWKEKSKKRPTVERVLAHLADVATPSMAVDPILKDLPDPQTVLSQWERLGSLDRGLRDYYELLGTLVDVEGSGAVAMKFTGGDAGIVINIIDEALRSCRLQEKQQLANRCFIVLRKLVENTGRLPESYLVGKGPGFQVKKTIFACSGFADVRRGKLDDKVVAVKTIRVAEDSNFPAIQKDFCKESVIWMNTSHPNVLELLAVNVDPKSGALSMVSELMENGNIMDYIRVNEANRIRLLDDVVRGLSYLHKCGIVHGDLKGSNILIKNGANPQACISDFDLSTLKSTMTFAVSVTEDEDESADIYAFGMVIYEVLTGRLPFGAEGYRSAEIMLRVIEGKRPREPEKAEDIGFGGGTWELVQQCWHQDREERPTAGKVSEHFQRVARTSSIIPPGHTISYLEEEAPVASTPDSDFARLFAHTSQGSIIQ